MSGESSTRESRPAISFTPLEFHPVLKRLVWGGRKLGTLLGKPIGPESDYAESWEICDHGGDVSLVATGPFAGRSLRQLVAEFPGEILGSTRAGLRQFPLLVKFLDAHQTLSVQVHPNDEQGRRLVNDNGKTEAWVILDAEPGSLIYAGLRPGVTREAFGRAIDEGTVEPLLQRFEARPGQCVFIPAGTVHAIGAGIVLAEIQQMSDATFRIDDWGRVSTDGKPRPLHRDQALESINFDEGPVEPLSSEPSPIPGGFVEPLVRCAYFEFDRFHLHAGVELPTRDRFVVLLGLGGSASVQAGGASFDLPLGRTLLVPAAVEHFTLATQAGTTATVLRCTVP